MAFGAPPKYKQQVQLNGIHPQHYLVIAMATVKKLNWLPGTVTDTGFTAYISSSRKTHREKFEIIIEDDTVVLTSKTIDGALNDLGRNRKNLQLFIQTIDELFPTFTDEQLQAATEDYNDEMLERSKDSAAQVGEAKSLVYLLTPHKGYLVTPIIMYINVAVFILMVIGGVSFISPTTVDLVNWGGDVRSLTLNNQWWRLFTCIFVHAGVMHLLLNMYAFIYVGIMLEPLLGKTRFLAAYLLTGILSSLTSIAAHLNVVSVGASGAIFGMYGVFLALLTTNLIERTARKALLSSILIFVMFNLVYGLKEGIDGAAHAGGLVSGLAIGYGFFLSLKNPLSQPLKYITITVATVVTLAGSALAMQHIPNPLGDYDSTMNTFADNEQAALNTLQTIGKMSREYALKNLKDKGIDCWEQNIKLIQKVDQNDLPDDLHKRDKQLIAYCNLRLKVFQIVYKAVAENKANSHEYDAEITGYNEQIKGLVDSLKLQ